MCLQNKFGFNKLGQIIYIIIIDQISSFKLTLVDLFIRYLRLNYRRPLKTSKAMPRTCHHILPVIPTDLGGFLSS